MLAAIVARAEGMPLYAVEVVRGLLTDGRIERRGDVYEPVGDLSTITVPESLRSLIASRLDGLDPADRALLQDASVVGQVFATDALAAVSGVATDELEPRLRDLARRELLDVERDPKSPERGQYKFMQSLIREVAYGTLARRDRRARHLAVARHYEALGDDELAGALASHYLAAREASDPGPEADAITAQARLALSGAADRAAALGGYDQAVAYLDQALAISTDPAERAPLLDRAADAAGVAARDSEAYAQGAIDAYRRARRSGRHARRHRAARKAAHRCGRDQPRPRGARGGIGRIGDGGRRATRAGILANLARVHMRLGHSAESIAAADEALAIAERLDLEPVVAEALVNKGSSLNQLGRRREAVALNEAALRMAQTLPNRNFEMRVRNNLAAVLGDDEPLRATQLMLDSMRTGAGDGRPGHVLLADRARPRGACARRRRDWDAHMERLREALETATVRADRVRLRSYLAGLEATRGEDLGTLEQELEDMLGDSTDPDQHYFALMAIPWPPSWPAMPDRLLKAEEAQTSRCRARKAQRARASCGHLGR